MEKSTPSAAFAGLVELAGEKVGGKALLASDEFFAEKENLLKSGRGIFIPDKYTENGKWMDGWESRRKRVPGYDWCILKLGITGFIKGVDIDTNHFLGNHPPYASIDACYLESEPKTDDLQNLNWVEILPKSPLNPGSQNLFATNGSDKPYNYLRLNIFPDGGVARLKVYGNVYKDWDKFKSDEMIDLAGLVNGGRVILANDMFFGSKDNMINPNRAENMGDGWETKRKRIQTHPDWAIVKLAKAGSIKKVLVDTNHFKGNYPDHFWLEGCYEPNLADSELTNSSIEWTEILPKTKLSAHTEHFYDELKTDKTFTHVRINIFPDGGISRLRLFGFVS
ncbi:MAG: allantoicase [Candidatus Sericytochromatia bacterium]